MRTVSVRDSIDVRCIKYQNVKDINKLYVIIVYYCCNIEYDPKMAASQPSQKKQEKKKRIMSVCRFLINWAK